jgi:hypothetical protein
MIIDNKINIFLDATWYNKLIIISLKFNEINIRGMSAF